MQGMCVAAAKDMLHSPELFQSFIPHPVGHGRHVEKRLDPALVRLYDPILPRAFGAANSEIRRNAINLLVAAFPICVRHDCV